MIEKKNLSWVVYVAAIAALFLVIGGYIAYEKYVVPLQDISEEPAPIDTRRLPTDRSAGQLELI